MPDLLLSAIEYGGYISIVKFAVFLVLFFLWLPLVGWVHQDARSVGTKESFWTAIVFGAGAVAVIIWFITPIFTIGMLLYLIAVGVTATIYAMHRDAKVPEFQRVLTVEFIRSLLAKKQGTVETLEGLIFTTANNNDVPVPEPRTPEFAAYKSAYSFFSDAIRRRVSDVIFIPAQQNYNVTYYIDGTAIKQPVIARPHMENFTHFIKSLADLDANEKRKPQKGNFRVRKGDKNTDWEVATAGSTAGEQVKLKQLMQQQVAKLSDIGLTIEQFEQLNKIHEVKQGVFIVAGPKKTGVTTMFYALLKNHDPYLNTITTLERRPSTQLPNITQNIFTLSDTSTTTYAKKLQSITRLGGDIIGVADCEDAETAKVACTAAHEDKIVYITLEADNVIKALGKWVKLVGDKSLAADTLIGISNQRLLRKLCDQCKQAYEPNKELLKKFNIPAEKAKVFYRAGTPQTDKHGKPIACENCQGTGFVGRMSVFEIIIINEELRNALKQLKSLSEISTEFRRARMLYLQEQALKKVIDGTTAINELVRIFSSAEKQQTGKTE